MLLVLWLLGLMVSYTPGAFLHVLLVITLVALLIQMVNGQRTA